MDSMLRRINRGVRRQRRESGWRCFRSGRMGLSKVSLLAGEARALYGAVNWYYTHRTQGYAIWVRDRKVGNG